MNINLRDYTNKFKKKSKQIIKDTFIPEKIVLGRIACLGQSIFHKKSSSLLYNAKLINQQKARCDLLLEWLNGSKTPDAEEIKTHLNREYVFPCIKEQQLLPWFDTNDNIDLLIMDSFSELTDQKFENKKNGWSFACHYNDLKHSPEFIKDYECHGLLPIEEIEQSYKKFFNWFFEKQDTSKVIFIHFPTKFDKRIQFSIRALEIEMCIKKLSQEYNLIKSLQLSSDQVLKSLEDDYPYHLNQETINLFVKQWDKLQHE